MGEKRRFAGDANHFVEGKVGLAFTAFLGLSLTRVVNQDTAHEAGSQAEEVAAVGTSDFGGTADRYGITSKSGIRGG